MIKCDKGEVAIIGSPIFVMSEMSMMVYSLNKSLTEKFGTEKAKELILDAVEKGLMTDEEREKQLEEAKKMAGASLSSALDKFFDEIIERMVK